jgi:alanyl-tRNA synthetase
MTSHEIRQSFLDFFQSKRHTIVPSSSLLPDSPNLLFTNAGMNQFVPIFLGRAPCPYQPGRAADTQKCIRAGGKHNDLDDVGLDTYHHTFFEMLGNWSFGDYFKKEAIDWAWELVTEVWKFPRHRLYATVYSPDKSLGDPSEFDQEAADYWSAKFSAAGLDPKVHIVHGNKKDNFWMMGETGPCGPCSELHVDLTPAGDTRGALVNKGSADCIEIWNLVFIQFNANPDGSFSPLPARHVDTGMGFERVTSILQCTKGFQNFNSVISNYETDIFRPLFGVIEKLSGAKYGSTLPKPGSTGDTVQEQADVAFRVIADHLRTLSFAIADGILPGNNDRNYVLRRILRRAVKYGRALGFQQPFLYGLVPALAASLGDVFPELRARASQVETVVRLEEEAFNKTLDNGLRIFQSDLSKNIPDGKISGEFAFLLYDTYGFPFDLTELLAREQHLSVDASGFEARMEEQRARARAAQKKEVISLSALSETAATRFLGFDAIEIGARVVETLAIQGKPAVVLDQTTCYGEMGGQVGDTGLLEGEGRTWEILNTQKSGERFVHILSGTPAEGPERGAAVTVRVERDRRAAIQRHHTVTHLLHWALHEVVSRQATQKGSFVGPEKLTFDFNSQPLTAAQVADVERLVNERVLENAAVSWTEAAHADVKDRADVMQFFGDKYGERVRVVQIGGRAGELDGYSMELCGGTHTRATGEIGLFRVVSESAVAAGVRRIEAVAGGRAYETIRENARLIASLAEKFHSPVVELEKKVENLLARQKELEKEIKAARQREACREAKTLADRAKATLSGTPVLVENLGRAGGDHLQSVLDALQDEFKGVVFLAAALDGAVALAASVSPEFTSKFQAGKLVQLAAPIVGGKGGGRPDMARGGGREPEKIEEALRQVRAALEKM